MTQVLLSFLTHPVSSVLPLALRLSPIQVVAVLLAALASCRALGQTGGKKSDPVVSAQVMLSLSLLSIILASNLESGDDLRPELGMALILRLVVGGALVGIWNSLAIRLRAIPARS